LRKFGFLLISITEDRNDKVKQQIRPTLETKKERKIITRPRSEPQMHKVSLNVSVINNKILQGVPMSASYLVCQ